MKQPIKLAVLVNRFKNAFRKRPKYIVDNWKWVIRHTLLPWFIFPMTIRHKNGARFYLSKDPVDDRILFGIYQNHYNVYFPPEIVSLPSDALILDIGAHHGYYSIAAIFQYPQSKIMAIEPNPLALKLLKHNLKINSVKDRVEVICAGIGTNQGEGWLIKNPGGSWGNYISETIPDKKANKINVEPIGNIINNAKPYLIKLNCEGCEFSLISDMFKSNIFPEYILLFAHPKFGDIKKLLQIINSAGYGIVPMNFSGDSEPKFICKKLNKIS
jgi:FkbM family methyltransferase